jgi:hypothetical protein
VNLRWLAIAIAGLAVATFASHGTAAPRATFTVKSTLDGLTVLPHRIHWAGTTSLPPAKVAEVDFMIDGKLTWVEHHAPYDYAGESKADLVTSWLHAGEHHFEVLVKATDGTKEADIVPARVAAAPSPPASLAGVWKRTIDGSQGPKPGSKGNPTGSVIPQGNFAMTMTIESRWIRDQQPGKFVYPQSNTTGFGLFYLDDYTADAHQIHVAGEIIDHPDGGSRAPDGGSWCYLWGPPTAYNWSVTGNTLTLMPAHGTDPCGIRGFIWTGTWTRAR